MPSRSNGLCRIVDSGLVSSCADKAGGGRESRAGAGAAAAVAASNSSICSGGIALWPATVFKASRDTPICQAHGNISNANQSKRIGSCVREPQREGPRERGPQRQRAPEREPQREGPRESPERGPQRERAPERGPQREGPRERAPERESSREGAVLEFWLGHPPQQRPQTTTGFVLCNRKLVLRKIQKSEDI